LWTALNALPSWQLGRTYPSAATTCSTPGAGGCPANGVISASGQVQAIFMNDSLGFGNYNSLFWTLSMRNFHGLTAMSNFTWSRAMGTGQTTQATSSYTVTDPWNMHAMYGPQYNDIPLNYNLYFLYEPGAKSQHGWIGHLAHGWSFAPVLTWSFSGNNGGWSDVNIGGDCQSFGEGDCSSGSAQELGIRTTGYTGGRSISYNTFNPTVVGSASNVVVNSSGKITQRGTGINVFGNNAAAIYAEYRPMVLGLDTTGQSGLMPGLSRTNVDFAVTKDLALSEHFSTQLNAQATNIFNHFSPSEATQDITSPKNFGVISGDALGPRSVEVGLAVRW
ncbi:MAG: hypothetical protein ACRD1E_12895, partial [Terriglobales bacterium]